MATGPNYILLKFDRLFGTLGGHIRSRSVAQFGCHIRVIQYLVRNCFGRRICVHLESRLECFGSYIALAWHGSGWFDLSSLFGAFACLLGVRLMLGGLIFSDRGVRSPALHRVCLLIYL